MLFWVNPKFSMNLKTAFSLSRLRMHMSYFSNCNGWSMAYFKVSKVVKWLNALQQKHQMFFRRENSSKFLEAIRDHLSTFLSTLTIFCGFGRCTIGFYFSIFKCLYMCVCILYLFNAIYVYTNLCSNVSIAVVFCLAHRHPIHWIWHFYM